MNSHFSYHAENFNTPSLISQGMIHIYVDGHFFVFYLAGLFSVIAHFQFHSTHVPQPFIHYTMVMPICCELAFKSDYTMLEQINLKKLLIM